MKKNFFLLILSIFIIINCSEQPQYQEEEKYKGKLIITEVGNAYYNNESRWIEVYNNSNETANLSCWKLRCKSILRVSPYTVYQEEIFSLPELLIEPGCYALIRGKTSDSHINGSNIVFIVQNERIPYWSKDGFVELKSSVGSDFVRFGSNNSPPSSGVLWSGDNAPSIICDSSNDYGKSIARDKFNTDTNKGNDWIFREFATLGGPNDVTSSYDTDNDGIPDCSEENESSTFAGLPLYNWGARVGQKDIFIHIDYMDSTDPGVILRKEALEKIISVFEPHIIKIHFDCGNLFGDTTKDFNLDGRNHKVPFALGISFQIEQGKANIFTYKNNYMPIAKRQIFHYLIMAYSQNADGSKGPGGRGELVGNDIMITLGNCGLKIDTPSNLQYTINCQAAAIMHELGHNLGLHHGGATNDSENYKPNYLSIMNYMYSFTGIPTIGNPMEGDRYYWYMYMDNNDPNFEKYFSLGYLSMHNNTYSSSFVIDFSDGSGNPINEGSFSESGGLGRSGSQPVNYNGNDNSNDNLSNFNINKTEGETISTLTDYDDWGNLILFFARRYSGNISGQSIKQDSYCIFTDIIGSDRQEVPEETFIIY